MAQSQLPKRKGRQAFQVQKKNDSHNVLAGHFLFSVAERDQRRAGASSNEPDSSEKQILDEPNDVLAPLDAV